MRDHLSVPAATRSGSKLRRSLLVVMTLVLSLGALSSGWPARAAAQYGGDGRAAGTAWSAPQIDGTQEQRTSEYMNSVRDNPLLLRAFLRQMPKGGDIHDHLAGAVYAEDYIAIAANHALCVDISSFTLTNPPCDATAGRPAVADSLADSAIYNGMIDAWSMRDFQPTLESGHDHFFNTFAKFGLAQPLDVGIQLASVASHAASQNELYLELMHTPDGSAAGDLGSQVGWESDLNDLRARLTAAGMDQVVAASSKALDDAETQMRSELRCDTPQADPGCNVTIRYLYQAIRNQPPERVFAQFVLGFELAQRDPRVVGINLVSPEDGYISIRDYTLQMSMLDQLNSLFPSVNISLHAGELSPGLVTPPNLRFHIRQAIELGHARRIGHGTDIMEEEDPFGLLDEMTADNVLVEISLFSSREILGLQGLNQPLPIYMANGVPVTLATDDEGVSRSDLTAEYVLATQTYGLDYSDLKRFARASIEYSFLPGDNLWRAPEDFTAVAACAGDTPSESAFSAACRRFLDGSQRALMQWQLEESFAAFESGF